MNGKAIVIVILLAASLVLGMITGYNHKKTGGKKEVTEHRVYSERMYNIKQISGSCDENVKKEIDATRHKTRKQSIEMGLH